MGGAEFSAHARLEIGFALWQRRQFDIKTNVRYKWHFDRFEMSLFCDSSNQLDIAKGSLRGDGITLRQLLPRGI